MFRQIYKYNRMTFIGGQLAFDVDLEMTSQKLYENTSQLGDLAFLNLLNRWNKQNRYGVEDKPIHVYTMRVE